MTQLAFALSLLLKLFSLWFLVTSLFFWRRRASYARCLPRMRFACLIAARDEAAVIGALVASLRAQRYPAALFDVYVIPNNCTDDTEDAARRAGAKIIRCFDPVRCKGDALHEAVAWLLPQRYDAFCVFDADNVVHPDFLARMNDALCAGARVAKGAMTAKNPCDSWVAGCYALYFAIFDRFYHRSRAYLGLSAKLVGTGFAVHRDVLVRLGGWNTRTLAEDAEFAAQCARLGERVFWVPEALTWDEAPLSFRVSLRQRLRWCSGILRVAAQEGPALLRARTLRAADELLLLCAPLAQALSVVPALLLLPAAVRLGGALLVPAALAFALFWLGMTAFAVVLARASGAPGRRLLRSVLLFPLFMASWLPLSLLAVVRPLSRWQPIAHGCALDPALCRPAA